MDTLSLLLCGDLPREGKTGALHQVLQHRHIQLKIYLHRPRWQSVMLYRVF